MLYDINIPQYAWAEYIGQLVPITHAATFAVLKNMDILLGSEYVCPDDYRIITIEKLYNYGPMLEGSIAPDNFDHIFEDLEACGVIDYDVSSLTDDETKRIDPNETYLGKIRLTELSDKLFSNTEFIYEEEEENDEIEKEEKIA
jgi:hypothetical protein